MKTVTNFSRFVVLTALVVAFAACDTVTPDQQPEAPAVLPEAAFDMDLNLFQGGANKTGAVGVNFIAAGIRTLVVNAGIYSILYVPAQVTAAAQHVEPTWNGEAFVWAADTTVNGQREGFALTARQDGNTIRWEMRVTGYDERNDVRFEDFLLYEANTGLQTNKGTFGIIFPTAQGPVRLLDGSYEVDEAARENTLRFAIPTEVEEVGGMKADYYQEGDWFTLDVTEPDPNKRHIMRWNSVTNEGSIQAYDHNNGEKSCWDASLQDVPCPVVG